MLAGMGLVGYYLNNDEKIEVQPDQNDLSQNDNIYNQNRQNKQFHCHQLSRFMKNNNELEDIYSNINYPKKKKNKNCIRRRSRRNQKPKEKNLLNVSENLTNNAPSINRIMRNNNGAKKSEPAYLSQFDAQTFDAEGPPSAPNDIYQTNDKSKLADLERNLSYQGGWTQYGQDESMSYGIVPDNELVHDNMVPFFNTRNGYGTNDLHNDSVMNYKNELFTGNIKNTWNKKKEVEPLFGPSLGLSYMYGTPIRTEEETSRYLPGRYRQGETICDKTMVTPGLNLDFNEPGTHGYHSMYRCLDKTVDELRIKPKITYEGRIIEGQRGQNRPIQAPVITYKPDTYKVTTEDDLLPTDNVVDGPKIRDNFIMKDTDRAKQHFEYTGGAYTSHESVGKNVPEHMREKHRYSTKQNFTLPKPLQKFSKVEIQFNPNLQSYNLPFTARDQSIHNDRVGIAGNVPGSKTYTGLTDTAKTTLKEITAENPQTHTNIAPNTMRGTTQPMDIAKTTIKETVVENKLNPHAPNLNTVQRVYFTDNAKTTTKETTCVPVVPINTTQNNNIYANWMDNAKTTTKETTVNIPYNTLLTPINQQQRAPNPQDVAKTTTKETTVTIPYQTTVTPINQQQRAPNHQDIAKTTTKETTVNIPYQTIFTPINQQQRAPNHQDVAKTTTKETTVGISYQTMFTPINQHQRAPNHQDIAKTTTKETTVGIPYQTIFTPVNQHQRAPNHQDIAKTTTKETTVQTPWNNFVVPINQHQRAPDHQDIAKTTTKETTVQTPWNNFIVPINQYQRAPNHQDIAKTTTKETTVGIPYQTMITPINQHQRAPDPQDIAKTTTKETTVGIPYQTIITPINQHQRAPNPQDVARTTTKETTVGIPYQTMITPVNQHQRAPDPQDIARPTTKETTVGIPYQTVMTPVNQYQRAPNPQDTARPTTKETTVGIPYSTITTAINQQQGKAYGFDRTPLRATTKETTVTIPYNTHTTAVGQHQRAPNPQDVAKHTTKETTVEIPRNTHTIAVGQYQRTPDLQDKAKATTKETTTQIPRQTYLTAVNQQTGNATSFNRTPLKTTIKETNVDNKYIGSANHDIYGHGYGYITEKMFAPNTNKQFTCQEVYIAPVSGESNNRSYNDAYNAEIDDRKDILHWYRPPTECGINLAPDPNNMNVQLKNDNNPSHGPIVGYTVNNQLDRFVAQTHIKPTDTITSDRFMDPMLLKQLEKNPFNIPIY